jgi:hypothetical protein
MSHWVRLLMQQLTDSVCSIRWISLHKCCWLFNGKVFGYRPCGIGFFAFWPVAPEWDLVGWMSQRELTLKSAEGCLARRPGNRWLGSIPTADNQLVTCIESQGILQSLDVVAAEDGYSVICGERRLAALQPLAAKGKLEADHPVPCTVKDAESAVAASLARERTGAHDPLGFSGSSTHTICRALRPYACPKWKKPLESATPGAHSGLTPRWVTPDRHFPRRLSNRGGTLACTWVLS